MFPFRIPPSSQSLSVFSQSERTTFNADHFRLLVWNVYKGKKGLLFHEDFRKMAMSADLILLQEAMLDQTMPELWQTVQPLHHWKMASSFAYIHNKIHTGVATGSRVLATEYFYVRSSEKELMFWTPKVSLCSFYPIVEINQRLLVINTHVVNFTTTKAFVRFVLELVGLIQKHEGPLILAGDFNTWNQGRWRELLAVLDQFQIVHVPFDPDPRFLKLDHVFLRGVEVQEARVNSSIQSSDHYPLELTLKIKS